MEDKNEDYLEEWISSEGKERMKEASILNDVKSKVSEGVYDDILHFISGHDETRDYKITDKPKGEYQEEEEYDHLQGVYVDQTCNGGYVGDDFAGTISIEIGRNEFFEFYYSC